MKLNSKRQLPDDLEERVERLGDPTGKTMREVVDILGAPQKCSMNLKNVLDNEPYMLMWFNKVFFYPLLFDLNYICIGYEKTIYETLNNRS